MRSSLFAIAVFVAAAAAQSSTPFYITSPVAGTKYKAGDTITIDWINGLDQAATVQLLTGTSAATMNPTGETFSIDGSTGEYDWEVPSDLPQDATFSFMIQYVDSSGAAQEAFSVPFTITGTTGDVVTQSFVTGSATSAASSSIMTAASSIGFSNAISSASSVAPRKTALHSTSLPASSAAASASASASVSASGVSSAKKASLMVAGALAVAGAAFFF